MYEVHHDATTVRCQVPDNRPNKLTEWPCPQCQGMENATLAQQYEAHLRRVARDRRPKRLPPSAGPVVPLPRPKPPTPLNAQAEAAEKAAGATG